MFSDPCYEIYPIWFSIEIFHYLTTILIPPTFVLFAKNKNKPNGSLKFNMILLRMVDLSTKYTISNSRSSNPYFPFFINLHIVKITKNIICYNLCPAFLLSLHVEPTHSKSSTLGKINNFFIRISFLIMLRKNTFFTNS